MEINTAEVENSQTNNNRTSTATKLVDLPKLGIINLSNHSLSEAEINLLSKGLKFCPIAPQIDQLQLKEDLKDFCRRMTLKAHFAKVHPAPSTPQQTTPTNTHTITHTDTNTPQLTLPTPQLTLPKPKNTWTPRVDNPYLHVYMEQVSNEIEKVAQKYNCSRHKDNLTKAERQALHNLQNNEKIVIKPADKGTATVIMSTTDYVAEGNRQLHSDTYKELPSDPTLLHLEEVKRVVDSIRVDKPSNLAWFRKLLIALTFIFFLKYTR